MPPKRACDICCDEYTKMYRKPIECPHCDFAACMKCHQTYLATNLSPECMSCHAEWNREFLDTTFPAAWMNGEYRKHREHVLYDRERARLPDSQHLAQNYRTVERLQAQLVREKEETVTLKQRLRQLEINKWNASARIQRIRNSRYESDGTSGESTFTRRQFVRPCQVEGCRGFLSQQLKCGICATYACGECMGIIGKERGADHVCDPNDVATAQLIRRESKPCPTCGINISKISGCDQMWCVQCRTAFSWNTGCIVRGTIHNPHYFETLRRETANGEIPRQPGDVPGGGDICPNDPGALTVSIHRKLGDDAFNGTHTYTDVMGIQRHICHLHDSVIPGIRRRNTEFADIRMKYLLGQFDDEQFREKLVLREKTIEKHAALVSCYEARIRVTMDVLQTYVDGDIDVITLVGRLRRIEGMVHGYLDSIQKRFNCLAERGPLVREFEIEIVDSPRPKRQRVD